jgi:hypothetical protein
VLLFFRPTIFHPTNPAAGAGQLEVLRFLQGRNCPINLAVCAVAASAAGHVHVLQWLAQQHPGCLAGADMDCLPTIVAAATGQLAVLQVWPRPVSSVAASCPASTAVLLVYQMVVSVPLRHTACTNA